MEVKSFDKDLKDILSIRYQADNSNAGSSSHYLSAIDPLTRVYSRAYFDAQLSAKWEDAVSEGTSLTFFIINVDNFKSFNSSSDTRSGDYALQKIAKCLKLLFRRATDLVARDGVDQFIVLALEMDNANAEQYVKVIKERIKSLKIYNQFKKDYLTVSIQQVVHHPQKSGTSAKFLIQLLDDFAKQQAGKHSAQA